MPTPTEIVVDFLSRWSQLGGFAKAVHDHFTPDTVWENVGMSRTVGPAQATALFEGMGGESGPLLMRVENRAVASADGKVLTERFDHVLGPDGAPVLSIAVMGIFEVAMGRIVSWRDYFDTAGFASANSDRC